MAFERWRGHAVAGVRSCIPISRRYSIPTTARPLRIELAGGLFHVTSRGDRREDIYFDDADRNAWLELLAHVCQRFNWTCHAWCQMGNHYHLVVETVEANLSRGMRQLNGVYTQHVNRRHGRVGHVFQGRYKAILVQKEGYLLELARYVVLNPVRAGMVADAAQWPWSSYSAMVVQAEPPKWLNTAWLLGQFGRTRGEAVAGHADPIPEVPRAQRRPLAEPLSHYVQTYPAPRDGMAAAYATGDHTMQAIAKAFGVHYATVSRAVKGSDV
jgi:REP element-mobilizing transposase RayT